MSKEKTEVKTEVKKETVKKEQYHLTDAVLNAGYSGKIDGRQFNIGFDLNLKGEKQNSYASVMEETVNPARGGGVLLKWTGVTSLEDLTDDQLWQLAQAKVILLSKAQEKIFKENSINNLNDTELHR